MGALLPSPGFVPLTVVAQLPWCVEQGIKGFGLLSDLFLVVVVVIVIIVVVKVAGPRMMIGGT